MSKKIIKLFFPSVYSGFSQNNFTHRNWINGLKIWIFDLFIHLTESQVLKYMPKFSTLVAQGVLAFQSPYFFRHYFSYNFWYPLIVTNFPQCSEFPLVDRVFKRCFLYLLSSIKKFYILAISEVAPSSTASAIYRAASTLILFVTWQSSFSAHMVSLPRSYSWNQWGRNSSMIPIPSSPYDLY